MLRILICCGGGLSSGYMARYMEDEVKAAHAEAEVFVDFQPFATAPRKMADFDVIFCCPHLRTGIPKFLKEYQVTIPLYVIPMRMYGLMHFNEIAQDARDVIQIYHETGANPVVFPNETDYPKVQRFKSYRSLYGDYHQYLNLHA